MPIVSKLALCLCLLVPALSARTPDPTIITRAMKATSIAEIFIDEGLLRVELEIGAGDLPVFHHLLPPKARQKLGHEALSREECLARFLREDWHLRIGDEEVEGRIVKLEPRRRLPRDEITGELLPDSGEGKAVLFLELEYRLPGRPATLSIEPPTDAENGDGLADLGFMAWHRGVAVNDFRYLAREEILDLDWDDPWFSRFRNKNLWRQYDSPLSVFLYVDSFEVRKEIVVRPRDLQRFVDLGLDGRETLPVAEQDQLKRRIAAFLQQHGALSIDGEAVRPELDRIHFLERTLRQTGVVEPPRDMDLASAQLGVIYSHPITELPQRVELHWDLFDERLQQIPGVATDEAGGLPWTLTTDYPVLSWDNVLTAPRAWSLEAVPPPPTARHLWLPLLSLFFVGVGIVQMFNRRRALRRRLTMLSVGTLAALLALPVLRWPMPLPFSKGQVDEPQAREVLDGLMTNVYRAFDHRDEERIYDILQRSVTGELLTEVYLDIRKGLELENQGGARCRVDEVEIVEVIAESSETGFAARGRWIVSGSVGHWGHVHRRRNQYEAKLQLVPEDGAWRLADLDLLEEKRL